MWFKKKLKTEKEEDENKMSTLEQVRKAYDDLSEDDRKTFHQSIADRVHESVAAQEKDEGDQDSQSAEDREHEALGAEHADERKDEGDAKPEEKEPPTEGETVRLLKEILTALTKPAEKPLSPEEQVKKKVNGMAMGMGAAENNGMGDDVSDIIERMKNKK